MPEQQPNAASVPPGEGHKSPQPSASRAGTGTAASVPELKVRWVFAISAFAGLLTLWGEGWYYLLRWLAS